MIIFLILKDLHGSRAENGMGRGELGGRRTSEAVVGIQVRSDEKLNQGKGRKEKVDSIDFCY